MGERLRFDAPSPRPRRCSSVDLHQDTIGRLSVDLMKYGQRLALVFQEMSEGDHLHLPRATAPGTIMQALGRLVHKVEEAHQQSRISKTEGQQAASASKADDTG